MRSIGVRELRQHASRYLREVERGETIEITDRGRPVAQLIPAAAQGSAVERLTASGRLRPPRHDGPDSGPLEPVAGAALPSQTLLDDRADER